MDRAKYPEQVGTVFAWAHRERSQTVRTEAHATKKGRKMPEKRQPPTEPAGDKKTLKAAVLEAGANLLQDLTPMKQFDIYVVGLHCGKPDPSMQMEAHHYCK